MELLRRVWLSENMDDVWRRCEVWLPRSLARRAVLVGVVAGVVVYYFTKKRYKLPPGPRGWPLLGNLLDFRGQVIYKKLIEWMETYGPVIIFSVGPMQMVSLNSTEVVLEALVKRQADFAGRIQSYSGNLVSDGGKSIAMGDYSPTWKLHRKLATKALRHYMTGANLEDGIEQSLEGGTELFRKQTGPFCPHKIISVIVFNIINKICFNFTCESDDDYFMTMLGIIDTFNAEFGNGLLEDYIPPLRIFPTKKLRSMLAIIDKFFGLINGNIDKHKDTFSKDNMRDLTDAILLAQAEEEDPDVLAQITDAHITQIIADVFGAGLDTSRFTLMWCVLYLAKHPHIQEKVHRELDQAFGSRIYPKMSDRPNLPYTDAVLHEVMRLASITPLNIPHTALCDSTIGGYDIPKGTVVVINQYALHHDPRNWKDPETFRPERFLDANGKMAPKPESWLPFSAGRRVCLGESVAKPELHLLLAGILRQFKVSEPPGVSLSTDSKPNAFFNMPGDYEVIMESRV